MSEVLRDRKYCSWLLEQPWFSDSYPYLSEKVKNHNPHGFFFADSLDTENFVENYKYFNLLPHDKIEGISLSKIDTFCYQFYLQNVNDIKRRIAVRIANEDENIYDIKGSNKLMQTFEKSCVENIDDEIKKITRNEYKEFLSAHDLKQVNEIIEEIRNFGGLEYNANNAFKIGKANSKDQEDFWEKILKEKYGDKIGKQFKFENCFFDFINISSNTIYECKLNMKDYNDSQYEKYLLITKDKYNIIYMIGKDCVINIDLETIYTTNIREYLLYQVNIPLLNSPTKLDEMIFDFDIVEIENILDFI